MPRAIPSSGRGSALRFRPPRRPEGSLHRRRITELIRSTVDDHAVTVVSAPSGYGKTTAVADWVRGEPRAAWLSLNSFDSDRRVLAQSLLHTLRIAVADETDIALDGEIDDPHDVYLALCDAFTDATEPVLLVVDDAHRAGDAWESGVLGALLEQPPEGLRVVLVGTPLLDTALARLRLSSPRAFVGPGHLAFTTEEISALLAGAPAGLDAQAIADDSQGWPIAARLMILGGARDGSGLGAGPLKEYVRNHVLRNLGDEMSAFVQQTTVCADLTPDLAAAVTERADAAALLDECARSGLFLDRFDGASGAVYRWHSVFARHCVAIAADVDPSAVREAHRRAARHLEPRDPLASVSHSLQAGDVALAREVLLHRWVGLVVGPSAAAVDRVCVELLAIDPGDVPVLLVRACALDVTRQHGIARSLMARAEAAVGEDADDTTRTTLILARLFVVDGRENAAEASRSVREMLKTSDHTALTDRAAIHYVLGWAEIRHRTSMELPVEYFSAAAREAEAAGDDALARRSLGHLAFSLTWAGRLRAAHEVLTEIDTDRLDATPWGYYAGGSAAAAAGYVAYWSGRPHEAIAEFGKVVAAGSSYLSFAGVARMMIAFAAGETGDVSACRRAAIGVQDLPRGEASGVSWPAFREAAIAVLEEAAGDPARAVAIARRYIDAGTLPVVCVALAGVLRRAGDAPSALQMLRSLRGFAGVAYVRVATLLTDAVVRHRAGDLAAARDLCEVAVGVAAEEDLRIFFSHRETEVRRLLADHVHAGTRYEDFIAECLADDGSTTTLQSLTERELDVFQQLQTARTLTEIAAALHVSINTVKSHQRAIYRKLGVSTRREAVQIGL